MNKIQTLNELSKKLILDHEHKPYYHEFDTSQYGNTLEPGSMPAPYFYEWVIDTVSNKTDGLPILGIEVGSFLGYSAIGFAKKLKNLNPNSKLICIDTWLGSPEHFSFLKNKGDNRLGWVHGYPTMYYKFISNVLLNDVHDIIIPLSFPSTIAFKILNSVFDNLKIKADFAYIDGSHEEMEVYMDLYYYHQLLDSGGLLCGDDWPWESVRNDVIKFCTDNELQYNILQNNVHWLISK